MNSGKYDNFPWFPQILEISRKRRSRLFLSLFWIMGYWPRHLIGCRGKQIITVLDISSSVLFYANYFYWKFCSQFKPSLKKKYYYFKSLDPSLEEEKVIILKILMPVSKIRLEWWHSAQRIFTYRGPNRSVQFHPKPFLKIHK